MKNLSKILSRKVSKRVFYAALVGMVLLMGAAHYKFIKPISWKSDLTLMYTIIVGSFILFPLVLSVIFSYILDRIKWLDKRSFLVGFLLCSAFIVIALCTELFGFEGWRYYFFRHFLGQVIGGAWVTGVPLAYPLSYILGWDSGSWDLYKIALPSGVFTFSILFALFYSRFSLLAKRGKKFYKRGFTILIAGLLLWAFISSANYSYVRQLTREGRCVYGLNASQCKDYEEFEGNYFRFKDSVYYEQISDKLPTKNIDNFRVIDEDRWSFALDDEHVYYKGKTLWAVNPSEWSMIDSSKYYAYQNTHSRDATRMFFMERILPDADPDTTVVFHRDYACNSEHVYWAGWVKEGADPETFEYSGFSCKAEREAAGVK